MTGTVARPAVSAAAEVRLTALQSMRGKNYWSLRPVTRMDLTVGAYEDISSADVPEAVERLTAAMPGLVEHRCSIGERGGFLRRLRRGTYVPHIIEHVALELQTMMGHEVGYGRTRGGDVEGEYTLVFEHVHEQVGLRAAALALDTVQRAFDGVLETVDAAVAELRALAESPSAPALVARVVCGVTGGEGRADVQELMRERLDEDAVVVDVAPGYLLQAGLPYGRSRAAVILDTQLTDVPPRYQEEERAIRLVNILVDAVDDDGYVTCPASAWEVQDYARDSRCRIAVFSTEPGVSRRDAKLAAAVGTVRDARLWVDAGGPEEDAGAVDPTRPLAPQIAAALAATLLTTEHTRQ